MFDGPITDFQKPMIDDLYTKLGIEYKGPDSRKEPRLFIAAYSTELENYNFEHNA